MCGKWYKYYSLWWVISDVFCCILLRFICLEEPHFTLAVGDPIVFPGFIALTCGQNATVQTLAGASVSFTCSVFNGSDPFTMEVYKDSVLVSNTFSLDILSASDDDIGTYAFRVLNACGQDVVVSRILLQGQFLCFNMLNCN